MRVAPGRTAALIALAVVFAVAGVTLVWFGTVLQSVSYDWFATVPYQDPSNPAPPDQAVFDYYNTLGTNGSALVDIAAPFFIAALAAPLVLLGLLARRRDLARIESRSA